MTKAKGYLRQFVILCLLVIFVVPCIFCEWFSDWSSHQIDLSYREMGK
jgi:predicted small integral membrane protein